MTWLQSYLKLWGSFFNIAVSLCGNVLMLNISVKFPGDGDSCFSGKVPIFGEGQM